MQRPWRWGRGHGEDSGFTLEVARRLAEDLEQNCRALRLFLPVHPEESSEGTQVGRVSGKPSCTDSL